MTVNTTILRLAILVGHLICPSIQIVPSTLLACHRVQAVLMQESPKATSLWSPSRIITLQRDCKRLRWPWGKVLEFITTAPRVPEQDWSIATPHSRTAGPGYVSSHFPFSRYPESPTMRWPCSSKSRTSAIAMGSSNSTERESRQNRQQNHADPGDEHLERPQRATQSEHRTTESMEKMPRQDYHELLLKYDELKRNSTAQEREIAFYRRTVLETSSNEMSHRMDEMQDQLREFSVNFDRFTSENSRMIHEIKKRSQYKFSMHENLDRLTRTVSIVTQENKALKEGRRFMADSLTGLEEQESESAAGSDEQVLSGKSTIHRKKASSNLRSQEIGRQASQSKRSDEQPMHSQQRPTDDLLSELSVTRAELLALQSKVRSAETHIVNNGGNLGALVPQETVKNVSTEQDKTRQRTTNRFAADVVAMNPGIQLSRRCNTDLGHNFCVAINQQCRAVFPGI